MKHFSKKYPKNHFAMLLLSR